MEKSTREPTKKGTELRIEIIFVIFLSTWFGFPGVSVVRLHIYTEFDGFSCSSNVVGEATAKINLLAMVPISAMGTILITIGASGSSRATLRASQT